MFQWGYAHSLTYAGTLGSLVHGTEINHSLKGRGDFPGGAVVKIPPAYAGNMGLSPGPGRSHMLWSN